VALEATDSSSPGPAGARVRYACAPMSPGPSNEGLRNDALRASLAAALAGNAAPLEDLLCRHGGHGTRPNLRLAAAFGAEMAALPGTVSRLLARLGANDAAPDTPQVFLPIAAAHGWVGRLRADREVATAWAALAELAGDERMPVRLGTLDALTAFASRSGGADALCAQATDWLGMEDREICFGAAGVVVETFANRQVLAALGDPEPLLDYLSRAIAAVAGAPRAAERSDARRRLLLALPRTLGAVVISFSAAHRGASWLENECRNARHPDLRAALSDAILALGDKSSGQGAALAQQLRTALEGSAKPPRDPTRIRPGAARGKSSRPMR
jgi:hypothetical protein